jgi:hypothetical protein
MNTNTTEKQILEGMLEAIAQEAKCFLDLGRMALAAFNLKTQSMDKWALQLNVSKGTFNNWKQLGMALSELDYTDEEMIACGRSTMYRIGNVIANQEFAHQYADAIYKVITDRAARRIDDKTAAKILAELRKADKAAKAEGAGADEADADEVGSDASDWWSDLMKVAATARPNGLEAVKKAILEFKA